jgi:hypothetical protein
VTIAVVQHASTTTTFTSGTTGVSSPAFASNTTAGNCLVAIFSVSGASATPAVSSVTTNGTAENWALAKKDVDGFVFFYVDQNTGGAQKIIDVNLAFGFTASTSNSACITVDIYEVSGLGAVVTVDQAITDDQDTTPGTTWTSTATPMTTQANEIWFGVVSVSPSAANTTSTITPAGSWTNETTLSSSIQVGGTSTSDKFEMFQRSGFEVVSSTAAATYNGTCSASSFWNAGAITLYGTSNVTGTAAVTQAPLTVSASGSVAASGTGAVTQAPLTVSASGSVAASGSAAVTQAPLTVSASGKVAVTGTAAVTQAPWTVSAAGTITARRLLVALASMAGTDDYGTTFPAGIQVGAPADGPQVQLLPNVNGSSQLSFPIPDEPVTPPNIAAGFNGSAGVLELSGSQSTAPGYDDWVQILMFSNSDGGGGASVQFILVNSSGVPQLIGSYSALGWNLNGQVNITGSLFVNGTPIT